MLEGMQRNSSDSIASCHCSSFPSVREQWHVLHGYATLIREFF
jgi:hypothetical protein